MIAATVYFALSLLLFAGVLGALHPRAFGRWLAPLLAIHSLIIVLFWPLFLALGLLLTVVVLRLGGLGAPLGQAGLVVHLCSWTLLGTYLLQIHRSLPLLDGEEIADDAHPFAADLSEEARRGLRAAQVSWHPSITLRVAAMAEVEVLRDVIFREVGGVRLRLDVYRPRRRDAALPAAVYIHGGGFITGTRRQSRFMLYELAAAGWVVFAISYRLAPRFPLPAAIHDCKAALAWIHQHGPGYGARPGPPVVLGGSAGGHLAAMLAVTQNDPRFQPGFEDADTRVRGVVAFYGLFDVESIFSAQPHSGAMLFLERVVFKARYRKDPAAFQLCQPLSHISATAPPLLLVHGHNDGLVPFEQSQQLYQRLRESGAQRVHLLEVPHGLHAFEIVPSPLHQRTVRVVIRFMGSLQRAPLQDPLAS